MFEQFATVCVVLFFVMLAVVSIVLNALGVKRFTWSFPITYFIFGAVFHALFWEVYDDGFGGMAALIPIGLALPGTAIISIIIVPFNMDAASTVLLITMIGGTGHYFFVGMIVDKVIKKRRERRSKEHGLEKPNISSSEIVRNDLEPPKKIKLSARAYWLCVWPMFLVVFGIVGAVIGGIGFGINVLIYKSRLPKRSKIILNVFTGMVAIVFWFITAVAGSL